MRVGLRSLVLAMGLSLCVVRAGIAAPRGPDSPGEHYWLRTTGPGRDVGALSEDMQKVAQAFGSGNYEEARKLAEAVLDTSRDAAVLAQAADLLIESYLVEGAFAEAQSAAKRLANLAPEVSGEALARMERMEEQYQTEVARLQQTVAIEKDGSRLAAALLQLGQAHARMRHPEKAEEAYREVIARCADQSAAGDAALRLANLHLLKGDGEAAIRSCLWGAERVPDSLAVPSSACPKLVGIAGALNRRQEVQASLVTLQERFPRTWLSAWAGYAVGDLAWRAGEAESAAEIWQRTWGTEPRSRGLPELPERLAEARYRVAYFARARGEFEKALTYLSLFQSGPHSDWRQEQVPEAMLTLDRAECCVGLERWQEALGLVADASHQRDFAAEKARAVYLEGCAEWGLRRYDAAVEAWEMGVTLEPGGDYGLKCREKLGR